MSTSTVRTKSGAVALDSAIRRATVCCRRVRSWWVTSPRPVCFSPATTGAGTSSLRLLVLRAPPRRGPPRPPRRRLGLGRRGAALGRGLDVGLDDPAAGARALELRELDAHLARHPLRDRRRLDARRRRRCPTRARLGLRRRRLGRLLALAVAGGVLLAPASSSSCSSSGCRRRPRPPRSSPESSSAPRLLGLVGVLAPRPRRRPRTPSPSRAIVSPTGSVSPSLATISSVPSESDS